jgi:hypothetical protein
VLLSVAGRGVSHQALIAGVEEVDPEFALVALRAIDDRLGGLVLVDREVGAPATALRKNAVNGLLAHADFRRS